MGLTVNQEAAIWEIVSEYHKATQGESYEYEKQWEQVYEATKVKYGDKEVQKVMDEYNRKVIRGEK